MARSRVSSANRLSASRLPLPRRWPCTRKLASGGISSARLRRRVSSRRNSLNAPGLRPEVRRDRVGPLFHRWYLYQTARYTKSDPLGISVDPLDRDELNPYLYALANPKTRSDPFGLYSIHRSCRGCEGQAPPIDLDLLSRQVDLWCILIKGTRITDPKLKKCIQKRCEMGRIKCRGDCGPDRIAEGNLPLMGIFKYKTAIICANTHPQRPGFLDRGSLGSSVIHEWAHNCGWNHGDGKGVPSDPGRGN